jgi:DNA (cytosine-5)-methyltransferase 1
MLQPHELAAAQGFPVDYWFAGNKSEVVKQVGNSVAVGTSRALCGELIGRCA